MPMSALQNGTIVGGFQYAADLLFSSSSDFYSGGVYPDISMTGVLSNQMSAPITNDAFSTRPTFRDPMNLMLTDLRNIAFRAALKAGKEENATITQASQTINYTGHRLSTIYRTDYRFMSIAVGLSLLNLLFISTTLYGWWQLGRDVSMSPFEIAKAFDAPLLHTAGSNIAFRRFPSEVKDQKIRYGLDSTRRRYVKDGQGAAEMERLSVGLHDQRCPPRDGGMYT